MKGPREAAPRREILWAGATLAYVALVHAVDTLAARGIAVGIDWRAFRWQAAWGFDYFKFLAWLGVPFVCLLLAGRIDFGYFGLARWRRSDGWLLSGLVAAGLAAVLLIRVVPGLAEWYPGMGEWPWEVRLDFARRQLAWTASWLVGWEFIHRYVLLTGFSRPWPRFGWLIVPLVEGAYHLQKHPLEAVGMVAFSLVLTYWALRRRNVLLPFLAHLAVELELLALQLV